MDEKTVAVTALVFKKATLSSSMLTSMVIFTDPIYAVIATIGAFVSMGSAYYDFSLLKKKKEEIGEVCYKLFWLELSKAFVLGSLVTVLSFMLFTGMSRDGFESLHITWLSEMLPSFWFIITLVIATESVTIWEGIRRKMKGWIK